MNALPAGAQLNVGDELDSDNGLVRLVLQQDGDLVLLRTLFRQALWASNTAGRPIVRVVMQADGNLVGFSAAGAVVWESDTAGNPGAVARLQDDGNFVIFDASDVAIWETNTKPDFSSPTFQSVDARGYEFVETSEWLKNFVSGLPCSLIMQWPGYASTIVEDQIDGQDVVIQLWKGWCPHAFRNFPGGYGAEVGIYRRVLGRVAPRDFPPPSTPGLAASLVAGSLANLGNDNLWWPFPELAAEIRYTLTNPVTNEVFFEGGPQTGYWLAKWMDDASYAKYQRDQGVRWQGLPTWLPGNTLTPAIPSDYLLDYSINGRTYPRW
jgi:hypothetical protein